MKSKISPFCLFCINIYVYAILLFLLVFFTSVAPVIVPVVSFFQRRPLRFVLRRGVMLYLRLSFLLTYPVARVRSTGLENIPTPCVLVSNHRSACDIYCMGFVPVHNFVFTARNWPFSIPYYTLFMKLARYINLEKNTPEAILMQAEQALQENALVHFFPEGHRSRQAGMLRFRSGAFKVAHEANVPVVPLCISGSDTVLPPGQLLFYPGTIHLHALNPLYPKDFPEQGGQSSYRQLRQETARLMRDYLE